MKNVQQGAKSLAKMLGWLLAWSIIGYLLLVLAYSLPVGRMKDHLRSEESTFTDGYYMLVRNDTSTQVDNITDSIILAEAVYDGPENPWQKAAAAFYASPQENEEHSESYLRIQAAVEDTGPYTQYARYWHGYLVWLKPLLLLMDYADLLNKFSYCFTFSDKPCTCKTKQQNTADINRACKYSECPICQPQIQLQEQLLTDMLQ